MSDQTPLSAQRISRARAIIDPVFLESPLLTDHKLDQTLGLALHLKLETRNPIRSFKGRGTSLFVRSVQDLKSGIVTASAGNFGQGVAYNATRAGHEVTVFAAENANPLKVAAMKRLGATVILTGADFDAAKAEARHFARTKDATFVEDGASTSIAEGAGTIAAELTDLVPDLDAIFVPLGNGALATGVGCWIKSVSPRTKVIAVVAEGAPCMALSWKAGRLVETADSRTIADGIAIRVPVPFALECLAGTIDDVQLVDDDEIVDAMKIAYRIAREPIEPAGAAGLAGVIRRAKDFPGGRVATILCGGNLTPEQEELYLGRVRPAGTT